MRIKDAFDAEEAVKNGGTLSWTTAGGVEHSLRCDYIVKTGYNPSTGTVTLVPSAWQPIEILIGQTGHVGALAIHRYLQSL